jgi:predicted dehydrogenase
MRRPQNRRDFIKTSAAIGAGYWVAGGTSLKASISANEEIRFACIGIDGKGSSDSNDAKNNGKVVAICDIDDGFLDKAQKAFPDAKRFNDYRKLLEEMDKSIDAVTVSTPDHMHAVIAAQAMKMGKHCFCQKPLTHSIEEARVLGNIAREQKVVTQMGNQGTADSTLRLSAALIKKGEIGKIKEVHVWTNRPVWPQSKGLQVKTAAPPASIHWDLWVGGAKKHEYSPEIHPFKWRGFWAFGTGALGDMACHTFNMPFMALNLRNPTSVEAVCDEHDGVMYPKSSQIHFVFPDLDGRPGLNVYWYDGGRMPPAEVLAGCPKAKNGDKNQREYARGVEYVRSPGHFVEFANAIKGEGTAVSNFPDYAGPLSETILLGNLALLAGKKVEWDAAMMVAKDASPEVAELVRHQYQNGYSL